MAPGSISVAHFINPFHQFVCLYLYPHVIARQRLYNLVPSSTSTCSNRIVGYVVSFVLRVISKENRRLILRRTYCLILVIESNASKVNMMLVSNIPNINETLHFPFTTLNAAGSPGSHSGILWVYIFLTVLHIRNKTMRFK